MAFLLLTKACSCSPLIFIILHALATEKVSLSSSVSKSKCVVFPLSDQNVTRQSKRVLFPFLSFCLLFSLYRLLFGKKGMKSEKLSFLFYAISCFMQTRLSGKQFLRILTRIIIIQRRLSSEMFCLLVTKLEGEHAR